MRRTIWLRTLGAGLCLLGSSRASRDLGGAASDCAAAGQLDRYSRYGASAAPTSRRARQSPRFQVRQPPSRSPSQRAWSMPARLQRAAAGSSSRPASSVGTASAPRVRR